MRRYVYLALCAIAGSAVYCQLPATPRPQPDPRIEPTVQDGGPFLVMSDGGLDASSMFVQATLPDASTDAAVVPPSRVRLVAFGSEAEFRSFGERLSDAELARQRAREEQMRRRRQEAEEKWTREQLGAQTMGDAGTRHAIRRAFDSPAAAAPSPARAAESSGSASAQQSITNNQEQGVDEGDIVKVRGDDLIILRRGRLFSVRMREGRLVARSVISAAPPGVRPASWYDEMLVEGSTVLVLGYGYERRATEVNRFDLSAEGVLSYRDTILLRSGDYYSSRNYATRVVGRTLVLYTPVPLLDYEQVNGQWRRALRMPGWRTLQGEWQTSGDWSQIYRPVRRMGYSPVLHTVHTCDLSAPQMRCTSKGVLGPPARTFYVSRRAVYLWVNSNPHDGDPFAATDEGLYRGNDPQNTGAVVYRFPFDAQPVGAVVASGGPIDQFSFRERNEQLEVFVTSDGRGDGMWGAEVTSGDMGLYRFSLALFGADAPLVPAQALRRLPRTEQPYMLQNRFVGDYLLYGSGSTWWRSQMVERRVLAHHIPGDRTQSVPLAHGVDRIEPMDRDAVIVGGDGHDNLHFTALALNDVAAIGGSFSRPNAAQGETRSHGFFYLPSGDRRGMLGLPLRTGGERGYRQLWSGSAEVLFLSVDALRFRELGALAAHAPRQGFNDRCVASCVDWYGNARPIFYRGRILALMGYELVEGSLGNSALRERSRINYFDELAQSLTDAPRP